MNDDLISRQEIRKAMYHEAMETYTLEQKWDSGCWIRYKLFERVLEALPPAQPELIRCKDCRYSNEGECEHKLGLIVANDENFCSYAERKGNG